MINIAGQYFLNHLLEHDELVRQTNLAADCGLECLYAHARQGLRTPYLSEEWWNSMRTIAEVCRVRGMKMAIWDEDYYPSPVAGNRIIWNHPELTAQYLHFTITEARNGENIETFFAEEGAVLRCFAVYDDGMEDITRYCGTVSTRWNERFVNQSGYSRACKVGAPHWRVGMSNKRFALLWRAERDCRIVTVQVCRRQLGHNTDILNPETTRQFLHYTHEEYIRQLGPELFREVMAAAFMDEPAPGGTFPWTGSFAEEFTAEHGYDPLPLLAHLALDIDDKSPIFRHHYRLTQMRLQCQSYLEQTRQWCADHGIDSVGHLTRTEYLSLNSLWWPNELRCCKYLDIPCSDPLGALVAWPDCSSYHTGLKVVVSAARIFGKSQAGSDALAVTGSETSLADIKFILDYHIAMGITYFNTHGFSYSLDGPRKDEVPPPLFYQHSQWEQTPTLWAETKQLCEFMANGETTVQTGVFYPGSSFYCQAAGDNRTELREAEMHHFSEYMLSNHKDFDYIDEITMKEWGAEKLLAEFPYFVVAHAAFIEQAVIELLEEYVRLGGRLWIYGECPRPLEGGVWKRDVVAELPLDELPGPILHGQGAHDILVRACRVEGQVYHFVLNRAERAFTGTLNGAALWLPPRGSRLLAPGESVSAPASKRKFKLNEGWIAEFPDNHVPLNLWERQTGGNFDLLCRENCPADAETVAQARFLYSGKGHVALVMDKSALPGNDWDLRVNGHPIRDFVPSRRYDCNNLEADITDALRSGTTPTLNVVEITGAAFQEMPYLYGNFQAVYRHGQKSLPYLTACDGRFELEFLQSWNTLGYGTFSGSAVYRKTVEILEPGDYRLCLGRVADGANVKWDGALLKVCIGEPFSVALGTLECGIHELEIEVFNGLGNHDRLADLPAGLLGPVSIEQLE